MFANLLRNTTGTTSQAYSLLRSEKFTYTGKNTFTINGTPNTSAALLFMVNGVMYYDETDVTYNEATKTFTWVSDIQLTSNDRIMILYSEDIEYGGSGKTVNEDTRNQIQANADAIAQLQAKIEALTKQQEKEAATTKELRGLIKTNADAISNIKTTGVTIDTSKFLKTASWNEDTGVLELEAAVDKDDEE